jgi:hypothetical protein
LSERLLLALLLTICCIVSLAGVTGLAGFLFWRQRRGQAGAPPSVQRITHFKQRPAAVSPPGTIAVSPRSGAPPTLFAAQMGEPTYSVTATAGPHTGQTYSLVQFPATIGRTENCAVFLELDASISRQHAEFYRLGDALRLRDLNSRYGVQVNGVSIEDVELHGGETIQVGNSTLSVQHHHSVL